MITEEMLQEFMMKQPQTYEEEVERFVNYCNDFYNNETGIYPIATLEEIKEAVQEFLNTPSDIPVEFDSIDREQVRMILQPEYSMF
jgi:ATP-dependent helicase YprA (DUF1998 family)